MKLPQLHLEEARAGERDVGADHAADVDALREDDAAFLQREPARLAAARVKAIAATRSPAPSSSTSWWAPLASAAALVALFSLSPSAPSSSSSVSPPHDVITVKGGGASLVAARVTASGLAALHDGDVVANGDVLQLGWLFPGAASSRTTTAVVVSVDGRGAVTTHLSDRLHGALLSTSRGALPDSYALDDAPRFERFFLVAGDDVDAADVVARATRFGARKDADVADFPAPNGCVVSSLLLRKQR